MRLRIVYLITSLIFIAGLAGCFFILRTPETDTVEIIRDDEVLYRFDLKDSEDRIFKIEYNGSYNLIEISGGRIRVREAGCRDNTCVKMGWLQNSAAIVCLPNHLVIRFSG